MIVVDSSVWIDFYRGAMTRESDYLDSVLGVVPVAVGDIIMTEVLQGFREEKDYRQAVSLFDDLTHVEMLGKTRAVSAANKYRHLKASGITVRKTIDVIIGSYCIDEDVPLLFSDRDFDRMVDRSGLRSALPVTNG